MKKVFFVILLFSFFGVIGQVINIPDANFKAKLLASSSSNAVAIGINGNWIAIDANSNNQIELSEAQNVEFLIVNLSNIADLTGIQSFTNLKQLECASNQLTTLNLSGLSHLNDLNCSSNQISTLNISGLSSLIELYCGYNSLTTLSFSGLTGLKKIVCENNQITSLNLNEFPSLEYLNCNRNLISSLNVNGMNNLLNLYCEYNNMNTINLSELPVVREFSCNNNNLTSLNVTSMTALKQFYCAYNQLTNLNISGLHELSTIYCNNNQLTSLNIDAYDNVTSVRCSFNNLTSLITNGICNYGSTIDCDYNQLTTIDVTGIKYLTSLSCNNNLLQSLILKNGFNINLFISNNPNIQYICADENQFSYYQNIVNNYGITNCNINSYCSFTPGGVFYAIQGNSKLDSDFNGCNSDDSTFTNIKFNITNGTTSGTIIANSSGNYSIPVQEGSYSITPIIENPSYFTISPPTFQVAFPSQNSPLNQNFCVTPNGTHNDLEINIIPVIAARPGFDATYKLIYKNKGTSILNGSIELTFDDEKSDFVSANPVITNQVGNILTWNYSNLQPFETREVTLIININSPMETPAVNAGDILSYSAIIFPVINDDIQLDNYSAYRQLVVNSMDPNDKICTEGNVVGTQMIGEYVHYVIRFENTGTFAAQNIVVKDIIDLNRFDISTLVPIIGSHPFITRINDNKVEFIFENINLPFEDATNDGFVSFKIKTLPTLNIGNTFTNKANIYFDYNFPIVTNTASTSIQALVDTDFEFSTVFSLSPIPTKNILNIQIKKETQLTSISIYNNLGQLVLISTNPSNSIDVSSLITGNYFIKIVSNLGISNSKFIKE